jgi:3'-phosphoadenosine 5'-phosphosulfate sulfotransferase (PAPS reductase)/FAD synthetase
MNISGGKDSTAVYLLALRGGAIMADTGREHPATVEYAERLEDRTGGPRVEMVRADF